MPTTLARSLAVLLLSMSTVHSKPPSPPRVQLSTSSQQHEQWSWLRDCVKGLIIDEATSLFCQSPVLRMITPADVSPPLDEDPRLPFVVPRRNPVFAFVRMMAMDVLQPGATQLLIVVLLMAYCAQVYLPHLTALGARVSSRITAGESHRLLTSAFLHADPIHLAKSIIFGLARLAPLVSAIYGTSQCLGLFVLSAVGGNLLAYRLGGGADVPAVGASAALLGLDGALLAYLLRNGPRSADEVQRALKRAAFTLVVACVRGGRPVDGIDYAAHAGGYLTGLAAGLLLSPRILKALLNCQTAIFEQMSQLVSEMCGVSSVEVERIITLYLRTFPRGERKAALDALSLTSASREASVPRTEDWNEVFVRVKEFVATTELTARKLADSTDDDDNDGEEAAQDAARRLRRRARLRDRAEEAAWKHFEHRAAVSAPSVRLLRRAQMGRIPLPTLRRWRVPVGSVLPLWLGDGISGLLIAYSLWAMQLVTTQAQRAGMVVR